MKITGYTFRDNPPKTSPFVDEVVAIKDYSELKSDYAIDITLGRLTEDPRPWLKDGAAYYGDYFDQHGTYSLHSMFPSIRTTYPGMLYKVSLLEQCKTKNPLEEICKNNVIYYIPRPIFEIVV